ncbi:MAG: pyridoxal phosphate-dependent aminotransferase [Acidobacteria bacterium]|nr:pyridoxal phosphate-dependent aminotransferase [Acidobacteriota bacterium]MYG74251.1 pyridoxal phosphate-dependent aminotransferase [Acidobacteriota bacterium]
MLPAQVALGPLGAPPTVLEDLGDVVLVGDPELAGHVGARRLRPLGQVLDDRERIRGGVGAPVPFLPALCLVGLTGLPPGPGFRRLRQARRRAEQHGKNHKTHCHQGETESISQYIIRPPAPRPPTRRADFPGAPLNNMPLFARRFGHMGTENAFKIGEDMARARARGVDVIPFTIGEPDFDSAPHINEAGIAAIRAGDTHYTDPAGIAPLREALAAYVSRTRGIEVAADRIIILPGAKPAIGYTMMAYVDPGDEVIYPSPGFPIYESWVTYLGGVPKPLVLREERGFSFTPADLDRLLTDRTKVLMLCSPSNPTGGVLPKSLLEEVAALVKERGRPDIRIYSDEIYEHITFDGFEHTSMASLPGMDRHTIIASGHSKGYAMTGWRLGWCVLPTAEEALRFKQININTVSCVPPFIQQAAREALENPKTWEVVGSMVAEFKRRRDYVVPALNAIPGISCANPLGAFYVFPNITGVCDSLGATAHYESLPDALKASTSPATLISRFLLYYHGVALVDRRSFGVIGSEGQNFLRLSYAADMDSIREGIRRIAAGVADHDGFARFLRDQTALGIAA